ERGKSRIADAISCFSEAPYSESPRHNRPRLKGRDQVGVVAGARTIFWVVFEPNGGTVSCLFCRKAVLAARNRQLRGTRLHCWAKVDSAVERREVEQDGT